MTWGGIRTKLYLVTLKRDRLHAALVRAFREGLHLAKNGVTTEEDMFEALAKFGRSVPQWIEEMAKYD